MIQKLANELSQIEKRQKAQSKEIDMLYLELNEINEIQLLKVTHYSPIQNLFAHVRPEVMYQILEFIDLKQFLTFRLVSKMCNQIIMIISPLKAKQIDTQVKIQIETLENLSQEYQQCIDNGVDNANSLLNEGYRLVSNLEQAHLDEIKGLTNPPVTVKRVCYYLSVLVNRQINEKKNQWKEYQRLLGEPDFLDQIILLDPRLLTEQQLAELVAVDQITAQQAQTFTFALYLLYYIIKTMTDIRRQKKYILKYSTEMLKLQIKTQTRIIDSLQLIARK